MHENESSHPDAARDEHASEPHRVSTRGPRWQSVVDRTEREPTGVTMSPEHRAILERMRSAAGLVRSAVEAASSHMLAHPPREGEWSALETLTHLRDVVVQVYGLRIRRLLYEDAPVFADFDEEGYRRASLVRGEPVEGLLDTIVAEHDQLARLLQTLPDSDWAREGRHPSLGVMSIELLARRVGEHAEEHAAQIVDATHIHRAEAKRAGN